MGGAITVTLVTEVETDGGLTKLTRDDIALVTTVVNEVSAITALDVDVIPDRVTCTLVKVEATTEEDAIETEADVTCDAVTDGVDEAELAEAMADTIDVELTVLRVATILLICVEERV